MRRQVILNIFGIPTKVDIIEAKRTARTFHLCFGEVCVRVGPRTSLETLKNKIERVFTISRIKELNNEPFINGQYAYVFGELVPIIKNQNKELSVTSVKIILSDGRKVTLKKLLEEYITFKVKYYEEKMGLGPHIIKIKYLSSMLGNNHWQTHVLNFNEKLVHFSMELIDSVIIHELCHDFFHNHSQMFYNKINEYCSNYKEKREKLILGIRK